MSDEGRGKGVVDEIPPRRRGAPATRVWRRIPSPARRSSGDEAVNPLPVARNTPTTSRARRSSGNRAGRRVKVYHVSLAIDSKMVAEKKKLRSFSVATVVDTTQGVPNAESIAAAMAIQFDPEWQWNVKPFRDGRFLIHFPSPEFARDVENTGTVRFPGFSLSLCPYSDDLFPHKKLDKECRWVTIKRLPFFCLHRDMVLRMLRPLGYLCTLYRGAYMDELRAYIRVRRGRRLPCTINCIIDRWQWIITVDMESGQQPLPWDTYAPGEGPEPLVWRYTAVEKGKGPATLDGIDCTTWTNVTDALVAMESTYDDEDDMDVSMGATSHGEMDATSDEMDPTTWPEMANMPESDWSSLSSESDWSSHGEDPGLDDEDENTVSPENIGTMY